MIRIVHTTIDVSEILESIRDPSAGGIDVFIGTTRNSSGGREVLHLEYEAFEPMAMKLMDDIANEAKTRWGVKNVSIVHRVGKVGIGEDSVVIAVSAAHRKEAFEACRYCIDTLKKTVPIWKKEYFADGGQWVGLEGSDPAPGELKL